MHSIISKLNIQLQDYLEVCRESSEESGNRLQGLPFWAVGLMLCDPPITNSRDWSHTTPSRFGRTG